MDSELLNSKKWEGQVGRWYQEYGTYMEENEKDF